MSVSIFVVALLVVAGVQSLDVSKAAWDKVKGQLQKDQEAFVASHPENANALNLVGDVWAAIGKYDCAIGDKVQCKAIMDADKMLEEEVAGVTPSKEEEEENLAESDVMMDDAVEGVAIEKALLDYVLKKEPKKTADLAAFFKKAVGQIESRE